MRYATLGRTGMVVSRFGLGTMLFNGTEARDTSEQEAMTMIRKYLELGGNHIDTANVYAGGRSEEVVGKSLHGIREKVVLATKARFPTGDGRNDQGLSMKHIISAAEASLRRLNTDYIDLYYLHCWDPLTGIEESLRAFELLLQQGKIRSVGVSNFKAWQVIKAMGVSNQRGWVRFCAGQYQYSLVMRDIEYEFVDLCEYESLSIIPWGSLGGGFLTGKYVREETPSEGRIGFAVPVMEEHWSRRATARNWKILDVVRRIARAHEVSCSQVSLAWAAAQPFVASVLIGARTMEQFDDNLKAVDLELSAKELNKLNTVSAPEDKYPYRMIATYGRRTADPTAWPPE